MKKETIIQSIAIEVKKKFYKKIMNLMINTSHVNLIRFIKFIEKLDNRNRGDKTAVTMIKAMKKAFIEKGPFLECFKRTIKSLSPNCRDKFIENGFINAAIIGRKKRNAMQKKLSLYVPLFFAISPISACNLHCIGCYAHEYTKGESLSFELVDRVLTEAKELGIYFITVLGGEPFIWTDLFKMLEKHNDMYFLIYTNGTLISNQVAKRLSVVGNILIAVSIEGFEKETDKRRGIGTYKKILQAMDNLSEAGVLFGFSVTSTKQNSEVLISDEFINLMIQKGCSFGWFFQYVPIGRNPDLDLMPTPEQRNNQRIEVSQIMKKKPIFIGDFWNHGPQAGGCLAGARSDGYFHINNSGGVEPCVFFPFWVDNIKEKKLIDVIQSKFFKSLQKKQPYCQNKNLLSPCPIIDHPSVLRKIVTEFGLKSSYDRSEALISDLKITTFLDNYAKKYKKISDPIWENELIHKYNLWRDRVYK